MIRLCKTAGCDKAAVQGITYCRKHALAEPVQKESYRHHCASCFNAKVQRRLVRCRAGYFLNVPLEELGMAPPECSDFEGFGGRGD